MTAGAVKLTAGVGLPGSVVVLGFFASHGQTPAAAAEALRQFGVLLTLVTGVFSAVWWHQSADLARVEPNQAHPAEEANTLNGAAATLTALALIASVYTNLSPWSSGGVVAASSFLLLLGMSGVELVGASVICFRQPLRPRVVLGLLILGFAAAAFVLKCLGL